MEIVEIPMDHLFVFFVCINTSVVLHANLRGLPILQQIREGHRLYGLSDILARYPDICQPFVPGVEMKVSTVGSGDILKLVIVMPAHRMSTFQMCYLLLLTASATLCPLKD